MKSNRKQTVKPTPRGKAQPAKQTTRVYKLKDSDCGHTPGTNGCGR